MNERRNDSPPPPRGAGAGGGGRAGSSAPVDTRRVPLPTSADRAKGSLGWGPKPGQTRQREFTKANMRAKRLRKEMTPSEKEFWSLLREIPGAHFRKQVAIDGRVFDFGEYSARLLIELDGLVHEQTDVAALDEIKQRDAEAAGFRILRFTNAEVSMRPAWVVEQVRLCLKAPHPPTPAPRGGGGEESSAQ